jgi:hypothetical protein
LQVAVKARAVAICGYRVITYADKDIPVFLFSIYGKGNRANLTKAQGNELRKILMSLPAVYRCQCKDQGRGTKEQTKMMMKKKVKTRSGREISAEKRTKKNQKKKTKAKRNIGAQSVAGPRDALAIARGEAHPSAYRVHVPSDLDIKAIRRVPPAKVKYIADFDASDVVPQVDYFIFIDMRPFVAGASTFFDHQIIDT